MLGIGIPNTRMAMKRSDLMKIYEQIEGLIQNAVNVELIERSDTVYVRNQVLDLLGLKSFPEHLESVTDDTIPNLLEELITYAIEHNVIEDILDDKEILSAQLMNCFVARPSVINDTFYQKYEESPEAATDYFYNLSKNSNYIQMNRIAKNIQFKADTNYGELDITINLSKPEKDPEQIKRERAMKQTLDYPKCVLCRENEGYVGRIGYPARANHRVIKVPLLDEDWFFQYSPYVYYNEHSIVLCEEHRDMKINEQTFKRLLNFVHQFPHYFIGSNADLPIVGGSILSHDHYQAGRYEFAMTRADDAFQFKLNDFPNIAASTLNWPMSVIRLVGKNQTDLIKAGKHILTTWKTYSDKEANIVAETDGTPHNTITPIARMRDGQFELDLVLRNNRTTDDYPMGIFHPHKDVHHIKKENIGLIEVMGLAVLPARLKEELQDLNAYLREESDYIAPLHLDWAKQLKASYGSFTDPDETEQIIQKELGFKFARVLEDAGVFKQTTDGNTAFKRFISAL